MKKTVIALGSRLQRCRNVITLGVRPDFQDYPPPEQALIRKADKIYYPTSFYADILDAAGKKTFPSYHNYKCVQDKIKQTALLNLGGFAHPRTRLYYGQKKREEIILQEFTYPLVAKIPRGSSRGRGVYLVQSAETLNRYLAQLGSEPAYIQEYLETDRDIRVIIIGQQAVLAYWRISADGAFHNNLAAGGHISWTAVPPAAIELAQTAARANGWDDVGLDLIMHRHQPYIIEANMKYGRQGFAQAQIDYFQLMEKMIENGEI